MGKDEAFRGLEAEFALERARTLGRVAAGMERALAELRGWDPSSGVAREDLLASAAEWLWYYVVQRETMGFYRHEEAFRFYDVPDEAIARMGPRVRRA